MLNYDPANTDESVWAVINDYSDLLKKAKTERLSNEEEVGLVGELIVLDSLMAQRPWSKRVGLLERPIWWAT